MRFSDPLVRLLLVVLVGGAAFALIPFWIALIITVLAIIVAIRA